MGAPSQLARYTIEEYLALEAYSNVKHEYFDGRIYAMAGGSPEHGAIAVRIGAALLAQLRGRRCSVYSSDVRVRVTATGLDTYPDLTVVCDEEQRDSDDRNALINPIVLVEVTSPSTADYDRGDKLEQYKQIPTLREVLLVAHDRARLELWRREKTGTWQHYQASSGQSVDLTAIGCRLDVDDVYRDPLAEDI